MTTGQIFRSNSSDQPAWSTATYPDTAGTAGNVLTSDGTNWVSSAAPGGGILSVTGTLTSAQIKALHATPIQVIAAPGSNKIINVVSSTLTFIYGGTNVFVAAASQTVDLWYGTSVQINASSPTSIGIANSVITGTSVASSLGNSNVQSAAAGAPQNKAVNFYNVSATEISGNAANNNTITYLILYTIV